jgi:HK97 family phage prohead protease
MMERMSCPLELKSLANREFEGYGSTFKNVDHGGDIVMPGAFKRSLAEQRKDNALLPMLWMHKPDHVIGKWQEMREDSHGLFVKGVLAETPLGDEIHTLLKMEAVRGMSIGFQTVDQDFDDDGNRLLKEIRLWELSVVSMPMNPKAEIQHVKSRLSAKGEYVPTVAEMAMVKRDLEQWLRGRGFSRALATKYASNVFKDSGAMPESDDQTEAISDDVVKVLRAGLSEIDVEVVRAKHRF